MNRRPRLRAALWTVAAVIVVAGIAIGAWMLWPTLGSGTAEDAPSVVVTDDPLSIPEPTAPSPSPSVPLEPLSDPGVSLAVAADGSLYRSTDGSCAKGVRPKVERSADAGATWSDVTPTRTDPREIIALDSTGPIPFEMVVLTGDACRLAGVGTYTAGQYWQFYDQVLAEATFIGPGATTVSAGGQQVPLPCEGAFGPVASTNAALTVLCPAGGVQSWVSQAWVPLTSARILSAAVAGSGRVLAAESTGCDGVVISGFRDVIAAKSGGQIFCVAGIHPTAGVALALSGSELYLWDGVSFEGVALPTK